MDSADTKATVAGLVGGIVHLPCWKVHCGGAAGSSFKLSFGQKTLRRVPRFVGKEIVEQLEEMGESRLLVWCDWRLDNERSPVTSSDDTAEGIEQGLGQLVGSTVERVDVSSPAWDLILTFSNQMSLKVFCDHVPGDPSFDGNWDLFTPGQSLHVGPGAACRIEQTEGVASGVGNSVLDAGK